MYEDVLSFFTKRRSIRSFLDKPVEKEKIDVLLKAAMAAPSAHNTRPWELIVVTDNEILGQIRSGLRFANYNAPCAIVVCGNTVLAQKAGGMWVHDCCAAMQNILLAAAALDLGSVWLGILGVDVFVEKVAKMVDLPEHVVPLGIAYIGYAAESKEPRTQFDDGRVYYEKYDRDRKHIQVY